MEAGLVGSKAMAGEASRETFERTGCPFRDISDMLRHADLRPTRQRLALGWLLFGRGDRHVTAELLYEEASLSDAKVSLATVYNTLNQFTQAGMLKRVSVDGTRAYFDTDVSTHSHFYIEDEGVLMDVDPQSIGLADHVLVPEGHELVRTEIVIRLRRKIRDA